MKIQTTRFGAVEISEERIYAFPEGLVGIPKINQYGIIDHKPGSPFQWLQATSVADLAFVICDPRVFIKEYVVEVGSGELASIQLSDSARGVVMVILTVPKDPKLITANLVGPLVFNPIPRLAKQLVLADTAYTTRHPVFAASA